jgi:hypothetical protein
MMRSTRASCCSASSISRVARASGLSSGHRVFGSAVTSISFLSAADLN